MNENENKNELKITENMKIYDSFSLEGLLREQLTYNQRIVMMISELTTLNICINRRLREDGLIQ